MSLKYRLTRAIYESTLDPAGLLISEPDVSFDDILRSVWRNPSRDSGYMLTDYGFQALVKHLELERWDIAVTLDTVTSGNLLMLERYMTTPFYLSPPKRSKNKGCTLSVFDSSTASQLLLYGGDLRLFLQARDSASDRPISKPE